MPEKQHNVLIADDHEADRYFLTTAIRLHAPLLKVIGEVADGEQVVAYLSGEGPYADREKYPLPELLILDVRMPRMTGLEVLEWLRGRNFPNLKVAMLADSSALAFREKALELGVNHFYPKCLGLAELEQVVKKFQEELEEGIEGRFL